MSGKFESMTPAAKAPLDKEVYAQLKAEKDAADPNRAKLEAAAQERMALKANPELAAKKAAEAKRSAANLARVRAELQAIKDAKESERHEILQSIREIALGEPQSEAASRAEEAAARTRIDAQDQLNRATWESDKRKQSPEEPGIDVDMSGIEEEEPYESIEVVKEPAKPEAKKPASLTPDDAKLIKDLGMIVDAKIPDFTEANHQKLEARRDELVDLINNNTGKGIWNALKVQRMRSELNKTIKALDFSLERYANLRRELAAAQRELEALTEGGEVKLVNPVARLDKKLREAEIKKIKAELKPFEKVVAGTFNAR